MLFTTKRIEGYMTRKKKKNHEGKKWKRDGDVKTPLIQNL